MTIDLSTLSYEEKLILLSSLQAKDEYEKYNLLEASFSDYGPYSRDKYPKHLAFFAAGKEYKERALIGGNRSGKTFATAYEATLHLTGRYPDWWEGRRYNHPIVVWVVAATSKVARQGCQPALLGEAEVGTGLIPKECIKEKPKTKPGVPGAYELAKVEHTSGGQSIVYFMSCEQGRTAFQGAAVDLVVFDEQCPSRDIYSECVTRTASTKGSIISGFTPFGFDEVVQMFMPNGTFPEHNTVDGRFIEHISFLDAPHIDEEEKAKQISSWAIGERDTRVFGLPKVGTGLIYASYAPIVDITVEPFKISEEWPRIYGLDVGYNCTAGVFLAQDPNSGTLYVYNEHIGRGQTPSENIPGLHARGGKWIPGAIDPSSQRGSTGYGIKILDDYTEAGLQLILANNTLEGITKIQDMLYQGQIKVFNTCTNFFKEYGVYRWDEKGKPVKKNDHFMDAFRYGIMMIDNAVSYQEAHDSDIYDYENSQFKGYDY